VEQISRIGMDTSKHFFQLHGVNAVEKVVLRKKLRPGDGGFLRGALRRGHRDRSLAAHPTIGRGFLVVRP